MVHILGIFSPFFCSCTGERNSIFIKDVLNITD